MTARAGAHRRARGSQKGVVAILTSQEALKGRRGSLSPFAEMADGPKAQDHKEHCSEIEEEGVCVVNLDHESKRRFLVVFLKILETRGSTYLERDRFMGGAGRKFFRSNQNRPQPSLGIRQAGPRRVEAHWGWPAKGGE